MTTVPRFRSRGAIVPRTCSHWVGNSQTGEGSWHTASSQEGTLETMDDWVTKPFKPGVTWVNSPMSITRTTRSFRPATGSFSLAHPGYTGVNSEHGDYIRDMEGKFNELRSQFTAIDDSSLIAQAATKALANVKAPEAQLGITMLEIQSTINSLLHPIDGALRFLSRNAPSTRRNRKKNRKSAQQRNFEITTGSARKKFQNNAQDLADQHLTIIFGLMPFVEDINNILKALQAPTWGDTLFTARGEASRHQVKYLNSSDTYLNDGNNVGKLSYKVEAHRTVTVRAFQQYKATITLQSAMGLSVSDIPKTVWQTRPLSFVVDWLVNVGDFISALTPVDGVTYIGSGYVVTSVDACTADYNIRVSHSQENGWSGSANGGNQSLVLENKYRTLADLRDHVAIVMKSNMHRDTFDTYKISAGISLLTQRLAKRL